MILRKLAGKVSKSFSNSEELVLRPCRISQGELFSFSSPLARQLAKRVGYASDRAVNLPYGTLAGRIGQCLDSLSCRRGFGSWFWLIGRPRETSVATLHGSSDW